MADEEALQPIGILSIEEEKALVDFLCEDMLLAEQERSGEVQDWKTIRRQRIARPASTIKNTPWANASNVCVPGAMIAGNTMYGITKNAFGAKKPFTTVTAMQESSKQDQKIAEVIQEYLQVLYDSPLDLNKRVKDREIHEEADIMGTCFVKVLWTTQEARILTTSPSGTPMQATSIAHDGPEWIVVPREEALYRIRERSLQTARWWSHHLQLERSDVEERFTSGRWTPWDGWERACRTEALSHEEETDAQTGGAPLQRKVWDFWETFIRWDVEPKDGVWEDLYVVLSREGRCLVRAEYNPLGRRPLREMVFLRRTFRLDGIGVGHASIHMQEELDTTHNQRIDGTHISGLRMMVARKNCGIKPRETLRPGKIFFVDSIKEDVTTLQFGEVYPSSIAAENMALMYLQKATLMTDSAAGFADQTLKTRDSIGLQTMRLKATSGVVGSVLEDMEDGYSELALLTFYQLVYNKERVLSRERQIRRFSDEKLLLLEQALSMDLAEVPLRLRFQVQTTDVEQTFEVQRQNMITLVSLYAMYTKTVLPLMMQLYMPNPQTGQPLIPPQMQEWVLQVVVGNSHLMKKIFEFFGQEDTTRYLPNYQKLELYLDLKRAMEEQMLSLAMGGVYGRGGTPAGAPAGAGTPAIPAGFPGVEAGAPAGGEPLGGARQSPGAGVARAGYLPGAGGEEGLA